jgi:hypothetical protein
MMTTKLARPGPACQLHFRRSQLNFGCVPPPLSLALNLRLLFATEPLAYPSLSCSQAVLARGNRGINRAERKGSSPMDMNALSIVYLVATSRFIFRFPKR